MDSFVYIKIPSQSYIYIHTTPISPISISIFQTVPKYCAPLEQHIQIRFWVKLPILEIDSSKNFIPIFRLEIGNNSGNLYFPVKCV